MGWVECSECLQSLSGHRGQITRFIHLRALVSTTCSTTFIPEICGRIRPQKSTALKAFALTSLAATRWAWVGLSEPQIWAKAQASSSVPSPSVYLSFLQFPPGPSSSPQPGFLRDTGSILMLDFSFYSLFILQYSCKGLFRKPFLWLKKLLHILQLTLFMFVRIFQLWLIGPLNASLQQHLTLTT